MTCSTASNSGKFAWSGVGIGEGTTLKGITFRLTDFFFNKGLEHESGFFIATLRTVERHNETVVKFSMIHRVERHNETVVK